MNSRILAMALAGIAALPGSATPVNAALNPGFNRAVFALSLNWKGADGRTVTCPLDDVSYIDLVSGGVPLGTTPNTTVDPPFSAPGSVSGNPSTGTLTFVKHEEDHGWWQQCQAAQIAHCRVNLLITWKFSDQYPGIPILQTTGSSTTPTILETPDCTSIQLCGVTNITPPASGQGSVGLGGDRDGAYVYVVTFSSLQITPPPVPK